MLNFPMLPGSLQVEGITEASKRSLSPLNSNREGFPSCPRLPLQYAYCFILCPERVTAGLKEASESFLDPLNSKGKVSHFAQGLTSKKRVTSLASIVSEIQKYATVAICIDYICPADPFTLFTHNSSAGTSPNDRSESGSRSPTLQASLAAGAGAPA